jgi:pimeloyl-ACP methyl ester carboxylesterase
LLRDLRQTAADVLDLRAELQAGTLQLADGRRPFSPGTQMHLVGYSLGGYLALTLRLLGLLSPDTRIVTFCAGARVDHGDARANPISPYILDTHAAGRLLDDLGALSANPEGLDAIQLTAVQLLCGATLEMRQRLSADTGLQLYASIDDRVVPAAGIAANLGRVDRLFDTGCHEYPFSFRDPFDRDAMRKIAKSYCVDPEFRSSFCEFIQAVLDVIQPGSTRTYDSSVTQRRH